MNQIVKHKDKLYEVVQAGPWYGKVEIKPADAPSAFHHWDGHHIPLWMFAEAQSFCEWSYAETKSEAMVHFYYHEELGWKFLVLPQQGHTGMSVKLIEDHPNRIPTCQQHLGDGWEPMGTLHHHCSSTAFQSMTDQTDERTKEGLHITLGHIGEKEYSIDLRASFRKELTPVFLTDWFEVPEEVAALLPTKFHEEYLLTMLTTPPKEVAFPEWWKDNLIKVVYQAPAYPALGNSGSQYGCGAYSRNGVTHWDKLKFGRALVELRKEWADCDLYAIYATLQELQFGEELIDEMVDCDMHVADALEYVEELIDDERSKTGPASIENKSEDGDRLYSESDGAYGWQ